MRVSQDDEEWQLILPSSEEALRDGVEHQLATTAPWQEVFPKFYELSDRDSAREYGLLIAEEELAIVVARATVDRQGRPNVLALSATSERTADLGEDAQRADALHQLVRTLAESFKACFLANPGQAQEQLRQGKFLSSRSYGLSPWRVEDDQHTGIGRVLAACDGWEGIVGVATPRLVPLGANVVHGTEHEARALLAAGLGVDGHYDAGRGEVSSQNDRVRRRSQHQPDTVAEAPPAGGDSEGIAILRRIESLLIRILDRVTHPQGSEKPEPKGSRKKAAKKRGKVKRQ